MTRERILDWCLLPDDQPVELPASSVSDEGPRQLLLFTPERLDLGEAWEALASLDFDRGLALFGTLAGRYPDSRETRHGLAIASHWQPVLSTIRSLAPANAAAALWSHLRQRDDGDPLVTPRIRRALVQHLVSLLQSAGAVFAPPDLARGALLLWLGHTDEAASDLRAARASHPDEPVVLVHLAEAEWRLGHCATARAVWTRLLLVAPGTQPGPSIPADLLAVIRRHGADWAPHFGWLEHVLPLVEVPDATDAHGPLAAYRALSEAEAARRRHDLEASVTARLHLRELSAELLDAYLLYLEP